MIRMKLWVFLAVLVKIFFLLKDLLHKWQNCFLPLTSPVINIALKGHINISSAHTSISPVRFCFYVIQIHPHFQTTGERGFLTNKYIEQLKWMPRVETCLDNNRKVITDKQSSHFMCSEEFQNINHSPQHQVADVFLLFYSWGRQVAATEAFGRRMK